MRLVDKIAVRMLEGFMVLVAGFTVWARWYAKRTPERMEREQMLREAKRTVRSARRAERS